MGTDLFIRNPRDKHTKLLTWKINLSRLSYSLGQWEKLERYLENGHLQIDNDRAERAIKPFVIGRKN